jgi:hypothetical protein
MRFQMKGYATEPTNPVPRYEPADWPTNVAMKAPAPPGAVVSRKPKPAGHRFGSHCAFPSATQADAVTFR